MGSSLAGGAGRRRRSLRIGVVLFFCAAGCRPLPDLKPFGDATAEVRNSIAAVTPMLQSELRAGELDPPERRLELNAFASSFAAEWRARAETLKALAAYADALAALSAAGRTGREAAETLGGAVNDLLAVFSLKTIPQALLAAAAGLHDALVRMRAARDLETAVGEADPALQSLARLLSEDLEELTGPLQSLLAARRAALAASFNDALAYRAGLLRQRELLQKQVGAQLHSRQTPLDPAELEALRGPLDTLERIHRLLQATAEWHDPYQARDRELREKSERHAAFLKELARAVREWARAHAAVRRALAEHSGPSLRDLLQATAELRVRVEELRQP